MTKASAKSFRTAVASLLAVTGVLQAGPAHAQRIPQIQDTEIEALLADYARPILEKAGLGGGRIRVRIINNPTFNAFVIDGRNIYVHTGTLMSSTTPNQVIGVLAHETGHITAAHISALRNQATTLQNRSLLLQLLGIGLMVGGAFAGGSSGTGIGGAGQAVAAGGSETLMRAFLLERQAQESAADQAGLDLLRRSGQSGRGMLETFERLADDNRYTLGENYRRTHPLERTRIALLREGVQKSPHMGVTDSPELQARHDMMRAKLAGYLKSPQDVLNSYPATDTSVGARYARSIARLRQGQSGGMTAGLAEIEALIKDRPNNPYFYEVKADFLMKAGQPAKAVAPLRKAVELMKSAPQLEVMLAKAIVESGEVSQTDEAINRLRNALRAEDEADKDAGTFIDAYRLLSQAYGAKQQIAEANLMQAEVEVRLGDFKRAKERAAIAQQNLKQGSPAWLRADDIINISPPRQQE
ncbi:MAG: M48 family metalloprotease [Hyphomicrobium sp.]